jgi:outer membrane protein
VKSRRMILVSLAAIGALAAPSIPASRAQDADTVPMSLSECLSQALENNLDLAIAKLDPKIASYGVTFQKAAFDPLLSAGLLHSAVRAHTESVQTFYPQPPFQTSFETRSVSDSGNVSITQRLNFGASYTVAAHANTSPPNSVDVTDPAGALLFNEAFGRPKTWGYSVNFTLPLLRGFGKTVNQAQILIAKHDLSISDRELRRRAELTVQAAINAYWDLLAARKAQEVAEQALKLSQDLYELNKKKVDVGTLAPIEITQAEANVASNVEGTIRTKLAVRNAEDNLRRVLAVPEHDPLWTRRILPTETPYSEATTVDQDAALATALERRAEVANAREQIEVSKLDEKVAHDGVKHQLDLVADWQRLHAENPQTLTYHPPAVPATFPFDPVSRTSPDWSLALRYSYPIANRAAKSNYVIAQLNAEKSQTALESITQDVRVEVFLTVRAVESGYERVVAGRKNVELQQKKLEAEQKKFENGMSTSFEVFTFQNDLTNAQLSLIQAMLDYNKALADLERAKGTLLEAKGLKLAEDAGK